MKKEIIEFSKYYTKVYNPEPIQEGCRVIFGAEEVDRIIADSRYCIEPLNYITQNITMFFLEVQSLQQNG